LSDANHQSRVLANQLDALPPLRGEGAKPAPQPAAASARPPIDNLAQILAQTARQQASAAMANGAPGLDASVEALKSAAGAMRTPAAQTYEQARLSAAMNAGLPIGEPEAEAPPMRTAAAAPAPAPKDPALLEKLGAISGALDSERYDVCLEPIIGLGDRRAQHYEVTVRLKDARDGSPALPPHEVRLAALGTGLLPLLDATTIDQSARVAWRLEDRGKSGSLFSQISGESLESDRFLNRFADTYRHSETVANRLILAFVQSELRMFSEAHWSTLRDMADLGFRFSLEDVTDLDFDFQTLKDAGFAFVKLDAPVFLSGLPMAGAVVPSADVCGHFAGLGLTVIVGRIADEGQFDNVIASGAGLGQGALFGEARPVKADVLKGPSRAVA
jgi:cyclic-di-GMP phosphodiesterase, flagellum assembly factor TipF